MTTTATSPIPKLSKADQQHQLLIKHTQKWVSQTFYGKILKQMRNSPFKDEKLSGGRGGEAFGEMFDQQLADRMSKSSGAKLVNAIVNKIEYAQASRSGTPRKARRAAVGIRPTNAAQLNVRA